MGIEYDQLVVQAIGLLIAGSASAIVIIMGKANSATKTSPERPIKPLMTAEEAYEGLAEVRSQLRRIDDKIASTRDEVHNGTRRIINTLDDMRNRLPTGGLDKGNQGDENEQF